MIYAAWTNPLSGLTANSVNLVLAVSVVILSALLIGFYLFFSFAAFQTAGAWKEKKRVLAFLPIAQLVYFPWLIDRQRWRKNQKSHFFSFALVATSGCVLFLCLFLINEKFHFIKSKSTLIFGGLFALCFLFGLVTLYRAAHYLWKLTEPSTARLSVVFSVIAPLCYVIYLYQASLMLLHRPRPADFEEFFRAHQTGGLPVRPAAPQQARPASNAAEEKAKKPFIVHLPDDED